MGSVKEVTLELEKMRAEAEEVAIAANLGSRCAMHEDMFVEELPDEDQMRTAYKIANWRILKGTIKLPPLVSPQDFASLLKNIVELAPDSCPECERVVGKDD